MSLGIFCESFVNSKTLVAVNASDIVTANKIVLNDGPVIVAWQSSDLDFFTPRSAPILNPAYLTALTANPSTSTSTHEPTATNQKGSNGLSTGAKAGIGLGSALGCLAVIATMILTFVYRRRRRLGPRIRAEMEGISGRGGRQNLDSTPVFEAHPHAKPVEADSTARAELEGDFHGNEVPHAPGSPEELRSAA